MDIQLSPKQAIVIGYAVASLDVFNMQGDILAGELQVIASFSVPDLEDILDVQPQDAELQISELDGSDLSAPISLEDLVGRLIEFFGEIEENDASDICYVGLIKQLKEIEASC